MDFFHEELVMRGYEGPEPDAGRASGDSKVIARRAGELLNQKRYSEAIDLLEGAVGAQPASMLLHQMLAKGYIDAKRVEEAERQVGLLHQRGVKDPMFSLRLATVMMGMRQLEGAILHLREAQSLGLNLREWNIHLGNALRRTGRLEEAETAFQDALATSAGHRSKLLVGLSALRLQQNRFEEAIEFAVDAMKETPATTTAFYYLGLANMREGNAMGAVRAFEDYAKSEPNRVAPLRWLERLARDVGDHAEADSYNIKTREMLEDRRVLRIEKKRHAADP